MRDNRVLVYVSREGGKLETNDYKNEISDSLWSLFERCWKQNPRERPPMNKVKEFLNHKESKHRAG